MITHRYLLQRDGVIYKRRELPPFHVVMGSSPVFGVVRVLFFLVFCVVFVCLCSLSYVTNVASVSGVSIPNCSFSFL